ncbi:lytic transglycosylase domain-containing protein [Lacisediminihabitans changchengi]|uniref:Lytic transglycosylase domain-containing protein n=1 Tax=Lacisediminihabitans changchengi TaxID=2787634 RepID=A0A934SP60_9MICO|nr:lytic transglycosylase domain-containing protein [Lacisediminihabitans changchengi]MBK4349030.1 lytic transglycosylase domain-containing protein [Lacisediminihabitans changchengi]
MRKAGRVILIVVASALGLAIVAVIVYLALPTDTWQRITDVAGPQHPAERYATAAPVTAAATPTGPGIAGLADPTWLADTATATGIPRRALAAYAGAALNIAQANPRCGIGWNTLAGVGEIESRHGTIFGGSITANGDAVPAIFGVSLDGVGTAHVPDSDGGAIDGDAEGDRAVGPMQLIPEAWRNWHVDGGADGVESPQNIDDATLAAAHYLCRAGGDLSTESGWRAAVLAYNGSEQYLADVIRYSVGYARDSR